MNKLKNQDVYTLDMDKIKRIAKPFGNSSHLIVPKEFEGQEAEITFDKWRADLDKIVDLMMDKDEPIKGFNPIIRKIADEIKGKRQKLKKA